MAAPVLDLPVLVGALSAAVFLVVSGVSPAVTSVGRSCGRSADQLGGLGGRLRRWRCWGESRERERGDCRQSELTK